MNKYICLGNLGYDPDIITMGCKLKIAVNSSFSTRDVTWINVFVFGTQAENCIKYKKKGDRVLIEGRLELSKNDSLVVIAEQIKFL